jgi:hypothetical protein
MSRKLHARLSERGGKRYLAISDDNGDIELMSPAAALALADCILGVVEVINALDARNVPVGKRRFTVVPEVSDDQKNGG